MKVLIGCEESQIVCMAFRERGHEAYSCDIQPCSGGHPEFHLQMDVFEAIKLKNWDLLIAHPPCTYFANAGLHYLKTRPDRKKYLISSFEFVKHLWGAPIEKICIENPIGWLNTHWQKPTQIIQPYYFGDPELKTTCLWLKKLPRLQGKLEVALNENEYRPAPRDFVYRKSGKNIGKRYNYYWRQGKSAKIRSKTFPGIAKAMAAAWSENLIELQGANAVL